MRVLAAGHQLQRSLEIKAAATFNDHVGSPASSSVERALCRKQGLPGNGEGRRAALPLELEGCGWFDSPARYELVIKSRQYRHNFRLAYKFGSVWRDGHGDRLRISSKTSECNLHHHGRSLESAFAGRELRSRPTPRRDCFQNVGLEVALPAYPVRRADSRLRISRKPWRMCRISGAEAEGNGIAACVLSDLLSLRSCWRAPAMVNPCS